jgi:uncharacterized protein YbaR (Trm112 family)
MLSIPRDQLVLDVGSGDGPFARADILCDKYIEDTENRVGHLLIDRPFVAGDIMALPFRDNTFAYVYCSHVLEHVEEPEKALKELMRVGRRGFIETPSEFLEKIKCSPGHRWYIRMEHDTFTFIEKDKEIFDPLIQDISEQRLINKDKTFMNFYWKNFYTLFNIGYEWAGKIDFKIIRDPNRNLLLNLSKINLTETKNFKQKKKEYSLKFSRIIKYVLKRLYHKEIDLYNLLACPKCKGPLKLKDVALICYNCRKGFHIKRNIPILLENYAFNI